MNDQTSFLLSDRYLDDGRGITPVTPERAKGIARYREAIARGDLTHEMVTACPLCGTAEQHVISQKENIGLPHLLVCCPGCGLIYAARRFDGPSLGRYYAHYYRNMHEPETTPEMVDARFAEARAAMAGPLSKVVSALGLDPAKDVVAEIGAGGGWNLAPFAEAGFRAVGFDYDPKFLAYGCERGIEMHDLSTTSPRDAMPGGASLLIVREVVEHVADPFAFLAELNGYVRPGGYIYVTTPSLAEIPFGYGVGDPLSEFQVPHLYLFDEATLPAFLEMAGFALVAPRTDLRLIARRVAEPKRTSRPIAGNYARAMRRLRFSDRIGRHFWSLFYERVFARNYWRYYKFARLIAIATSAQRRRAFLDRRRQTGI